MQPTILKVGTAALANENGSEVVVITCEPFSGHLEGANRIARLTPGSCTVSVFR